MQIIYDGRKVQVWEFVFQGLNIGKWETFSLGETQGNIVMGLLL